MDKSFRKNIILCMFTRKYWSKNIKKTSEVHNEELGRPYLACNDERALFTSDVYKKYNLWSCQKVCETLVYLSDNILLDLELKFIDKL